MTILKCLCGKEKEIDLRESVQPDASYTCGPRCASEREFRDRFQAIACLPFPDSEREWFQLAEDLGLDSVMAKDLCDVVREGGWRDQPHVRAVVKRATRKRAAQAGIVRELYVPDAQGAKRLRFSGEPTFAELASGDMSGEEVADYKLHELQQRTTDDGTNAIVLAVRITDRERKTIQSQRDWYARIAAQEVAALQKNPQIGPMLDSELMEVVVAISHGLTRREFIEDGALWIYSAARDDSEATPRQKKQRAAAWHRLYWLKQHNPKLRRKLRDLAGRSRTMCEHRPERPSEIRARKREQAERARRVRAWEAERARERREADNPKRGEGISIIQYPQLSRPTITSIPRRRLANDFFVVSSSSPSLDWNECDPMDDPRE
jgi:hypothetical protein